MNLYEVRYTVYTDRDHMNFDPNLWNCAETVQALSSNQATALVESKYNGCAVITAITQVG